MNAMEGKEPVEESDISETEVTESEVVTETEEVPAQVESLGPEVQPESPAESVDDNVTVEGQTETEVEEYIPTMTYKVRDEEKQFDDRFKGILKSKDDEDFLRDLYTKADGLDTYKTKLGATEQTIAQLQGHLNQAADYYKTIGTAVESKDMAKIANTLGLDNDVVLDYAMKLVEESELPENQRQEVQAARELRFRQESLEAQNAELQGQLQEIQQGNVQSQEAALINNQANMVNSSISSNYSDLNSTLTNAGINMFDLVVAEGHQEFLQTGVEPTNINAIVDRVAQKFNNLIPATPAPAPVQAPAQTSRPAAIPKITGDPSSPMDRRVVSLEQLQAEFNKDYGQPSFY